MAEEDKATEELTRLQAAGEGDDDLELSLEALSALREHMTAPPEAAREAVATVASAEGGDYGNTGVVDNTQFQKQEYWEERFAEEPEYDWLVNFKALEGLLDGRVSKTDRILMVGCGNSTLSADMYSAGFTSIVNVDFSQVVIDSMAAKYADMTQMEWRCMDMTCMDGFAAEEFDVVLDKAAMDAIVTTDTEDPWNPDPDTKAKVHAMCSEVMRVLKPRTGKFVQVTFQQPHFRTPYLSRGFEASGVTDVDAPVHIDEGLGYFLYTVAKK